MPGGLRAAPPHQGTGWVGACAQRMFPPITLPEVKASLSRQSRPGYMWLCGDMRAAHVSTQPHVSGERRRREAACMSEIEPPLKKWNRVGSRIVKKHDLNSIYWFGEQWVAEKQRWMIPYRGVANRKISPYAMCRILSYF